MTKPRIITNGSRVNEQPASQLKQEAFEMGNTFNELPGWR